MWFVFGVFVGFMFGMFIMAMLFVSRDDERIQFQRQLSQ
jgi:hypothetical protein